MRFFNVIFKRFNMIQLIQEILYILVGYMIFFISISDKRDKKVGIWV